MAGMGNPAATIPQSSSKFRDDLLGTTELRPREEEVAYDPLWLLSRLSNIDKHRRLHLTAWWPGHRLLGIG